MRLALREMRRAVGRFALLIVSVGLLLFLILFQQAIRDALITSFTGAIENQSAPILVFSVDGLHSLEGSTITPDLQRDVEAVDGVGAAGRIGQGSFTAETGDRTVTVSLLGYEEPDLGAPVDLTEGRLPREAGEVVAIDTAGDGLAIGDTPEIRPGDLRLTVVGTAPRIGLGAQPTLFGTWATYEAAVEATNPAAGEVPPSVLGVTAERGVSDDELVRRIDDAVPDAEALTRQDAADAAPGVSQISRSFQLIFGLYGLVVPLVTGLFFLILTLQKADSLTLLRAVGVTGSALVRSLIVQVVIVLGLGIAVGVGLYAPLSGRRIGELPLRFDAGSVAVWAGLLLLLGITGSLVSARRVLRIEPVEATKGAGVRL